VEETSTEAGTEPRDVEFDTTLDPLGINGCRVVDPGNPQNEHFESGDPFESLKKPDLRLSDR
jgi:hypothetical protein